MPFSVRENCTCCGGLARLAARAEQRLVPGRHLRRLLER